MDPNLNQLAELLPGIAAQMRTALGNLYLASSSIISASAREADPKLDDRAALLDKSYFQLLRLVNDLTAAGHLGGNQAPITVDRDLAQLVNSVCEQVSSLVELAGLEFRWSCDLSDACRAVDPDDMEQLLLRLLSNAIKFTPPGGTVSVRLRRNGTRLLLSVADTGCGISQERAALLDNALHADPLTPPPYGLGLGLLLCRQIAERHGGSLLLESRPGQGTCVTLSLPDRRTGNMTVSDVPFDYCGGFNRTLAGLADALPRKAFTIRNQS